VTAPAPGFLLPIIIMLFYNTVFPSIQVCIHLDYCLFQLFSGMLAERVNVGHTDLGDLILSRDRMKELPAKAPYEDFFVFGLPDMPIDEILSLWHTVKLWEKSGKFETVRKIGNL